ncbi:MAG TPA: glycerate kinase [Cytophagaceae bacterium]
MKILICPDSFKESLAAQEVAECIAQGIWGVMPEVEIQQLPLADGGEGTCSILVSNTGGQLQQTEVHDPLMRKISSYYGILGDGETAVIEMSVASGLELLKENERNPLVTTTYGTGELIKHAIKNGCRKLIIGLGGSATNDAGAGMAAALGYQLLDAEGKPVGWGGGSLGELASIEVDKDLLKSLLNVKVIAACDVTNPLTGTTGASYVYGPQKGASPDQVKILDNNLKSFAKVIERDLGKSIADTPGAGAAGGLGAGVMTFLNAELRSGFGIVAEILKLEEAIKSADLVITGEGRVDAQTLKGKVPAGVAGMAARYNKPVVVFTGAIGEGAEALYKEGVSVIVPIVDGPMELSEAKQKTGELLKKSAERTMRLVRLDKEFKRLA